MTIQLPIMINRTKPFSRPESPYGQCGACQYVGVDAQLGGTCPKCGASFAKVCGNWPSAEFDELYDDVVFAYNDGRAELAAVASAMYFEAHVFHLIRWGIHWLDPDLNWVGVAFEDVKDKRERIIQHLDTIKSSDATKEALEKLFGVSPQQMLKNVLGTDARPFWDNYQRLADLRNHMVHRGHRVSYRTCDVQTNEKASQQILTASIHFVPQCWVVFSKLWNEYIHKPMLIKRQQGSI